MHRSLEPLVAEASTLPLASVSGNGGHRSPPPSRQSSQNSVRKGGNTIPLHSRMHATWLNNTQHNSVKHLVDILSGIIIKKSYNADVWNGPAESHRAGMRSYVMN